MNKLWVFGDSYSEPFTKTDNSLWKINYLKWKGYSAKCYGEFVSEKLQLKHVNLAMSGTDNYTILDSIINTLHTISSDDIIIIGWSNTLRYRVVNKNNNFTTIRPNSLAKTLSLNKMTSYLPLSDETITEMSINRDNTVYLNELNNYIKLINFAFPNNKIIHWSPFYLESNGLNTTFINSNFYEQVIQETNGKIDDRHFSENGHLEIAENIINAISNYESPKFKKNLM